MIFLYVPGGLHHDVLNTERPCHHGLNIPPGKRRVGLQFQSNDGGSMPGGLDYGVLNIPPGKRRVGLQCQSNDGGCIPGGPNHDVLNIPPGKRRVGL